MGRSRASGARVLANLAQLGVSRCAGRTTTAESPRPLQRSLEHPRGNATFFHSLFTVRRGFRHPDTPKSASG
eukprot:13765178-Alexandrium_andersonii.AAC.1